jgi:hypothetical protein
MLDSKVTEGAAQAAQKKAEASPRRDDFVSEFGADTVTDLPNGEWEVNLEGIDKVRRYTEMMEGVRKIDIERGAEVNSRIESEVMYDAQGRTVHVLSQSFTPVIRDVDGLPIDMVAGTQAGLRRLLQPAWNRLEA